MKEMYKGVVNSPETTITNDISNTDTLIYVLDDSRVPDNLPNLMTIGTGTNAETIKVVSKDGSAIMVVRGFQGIAKSWPAGSIIARNFTEYDYNALMENIDTNEDDILSLMNYVGDLESLDTDEKANIVLALNETHQGLKLHKTDGTSHAKTARFVIGTSTAGWTVAECDYLCDGTADQTEINAAITALPATGGEIVILDGTYNITAKIDVTKDNVSTRGNGNATILKRMFNSSVKEGVITLTSRSGCKIDNLQIEGNKASYTNSNDYGIYLNSSSNNTITGNTCNNSSSYGIYLNSSSNNTVTGNTCNNSRSGIYLNSSSNNTVTGNTCNNNNYGIYLSSSSNNTVTGNTCNNNKDYGINLSSSSNNNTVTGNTCNNNKDYGINLSSSSNTITGNTCNNNSNYGICLSSSSSNNTITGNTCNNNSRSGIYLNSSSNTITGNTCNNNDYGINLNSTGSNNTVTSNTCNNNSRSGIYLNSSSNNTVTGNTCIRGTGLTTDYNESQHTIQLKSTGNSYNLISNNNCMGKAVTNEGGTGNTLVNNKFDAA